MGALHPKNCSNGTCAMPEPIFQRRHTHMMHSLDIVASRFLSSGGSSQAPWPVRITRP